MCKYNREQILKNTVNIEYTIEQVYSPTQKGILAFMCHVGIAELVPFQYYTRAMARNHYQKTPALFVSGRLQGSMSFPTQSILGK